MIYFFRSSRTILLILISVLLPLLLKSQGQGASESKMNRNEYYYSLPEALKNPENVIYLDLSFTGLKHFPSEIFQFRNLRTLKLNGNYIGKIPDSLPVLTHLQRLELANNPDLNIQSLVKAIEGMKEINYLNLRNSELHYLPVNISSIKGLKYLDLSNNRINELPAEARKLINLEQLNLSRTQITELSVDFVSWKNLKMIDLSFCPDLNLSQVLPVLSMMPALERLDLKGVKLIPDEISMLANIKELDISESTLKSLSSGIRKMENLKKITIVNCSQINYASLFAKLAQIKSLNELETGDDAMISFPSGFSMMKHIGTLTLRGRNLKELPEEFSNQQNLKTLNFIFCPALDLEKVFEVAGKFENLEVLSIRFCGQYQLPPNIIRLTQIRLLDVSGNNITYIPPTIKFLQQLRVLNLLENPIEASIVADIKSEMTDLTILFEKKVPLIRSFKAVNPPLPDYTGETEIIRFSSENSGVQKIKVGEKASLIIPPDAFLDKSGKPVTGDVNVQVTVYPDPVALIFSGVPMYIDSGKNKLPFSSQGMIFFNATRNGEQLFPNPGSLINVEMISNTDDKGYSVWNYDTNKQNWIYKGKDAIITYDSSYPPIEEIKAPQRPVIYKRPMLQNVYFCFPKKNDPKRFEFSVYGSKSKFRVGSDENKWVKNYPELKLLSRITFIYDGSNPKDDFKMLKSISKRTTPQCLVIDPRITLRKDADNYLFSFVFRGDTISIPVSLKTLAKDPDQIQKANLRFYSGYCKLLDLREKKWRYLDSLMAIQIREYEAKMNDFAEKYRAYIKLLRESNNRQTANFQFFTRSFQLDAFGWYNIDKIYKLEDQCKMIPGFISIDNEPLPAKNVCVIDYKNKGLISAKAGEMLYYDRSSKVSIVVFLENNFLGIVPSSTIARLPNDKVVYRLLPAITFPLENMTVAKLRLILESIENESSLKNQLYP